jgi:hypothetical protein
VTLLSYADFGLRDFSTIITISSLDLAKNVCDDQAEGQGKSRETKGPKFPLDFPPTFVYFYSESLDIVSVLLPISLTSFATWQSRDVVKFLSACINKRKEVRNEYRHNFSKWPSHPF